MADIHDSEDFLELILDSKSATNPYLLVSPLKEKLGDDGQGEIVCEPIRIRIGRRPIVRNLRALYEALDRQVPPELEVFLAYDMWIISHTVGVMQESTRGMVRQLGFEVRFPETPRVTVLELLPETKFIKRVEWGLECKADIKLNGEASLPGMEAAPVGVGEKLSFGAHIAATGAINTAAQISFSVLTTTVSAIGKGDTRSEWLLVKDEKPLIGDIILVQTILTPKRLRKIDFQARTYATVSAGWFSLPIQQRSDWIKLHGDLKQE